MVGKVAVGYVRVSTDRQVEEGLSIDDQKQQVRAYCDAKGFAFGGFYEELGESARRDRRPELQRLLADAQGGETPFNFVVIYNTHRFFRNNMERAFFERRLEAVGVRVLSVTQPIEGEGATTELLKNLLGSVDQYQSDQNAENVIRCMRENARRGNFNGSRPPFGYETVQTAEKSRCGYKKKLAVATREAELVRRIYNLSVYGQNGCVMGYKAIAEHLNEAGYTYRGKSWRVHQVWRILRSPTYDGKYATFVYDSRRKRDRPEEEHIVSEVPRIIDHDLWEAAQELISGRRIECVGARAEQSPSLLTGLLFCAYCRQPVHACTGKGGMYHYYRCSTKAKESVRRCELPNIPKAILEGAITTAVTGSGCCPDKVDTLA